MEYRIMGPTGLPLSEVSFGSWITFGNQIDARVSAELMEFAYDRGVNFFDNAETYAHGHSEEVMGQILQAKGWSRDTWCVSSKVFFGTGGQAPTQRGLHRKHIIEACHAALRRLRVEYLDLYMCHRPDKKTPIEETVWTMHQLIQQGKILYWGTSEWSAAEILEAHRIAALHHLIGPVVEQPQYNALVREKMEAEYLDVFRTVGMGTTTWSPLASGVLTGKYMKGGAEAHRLGREELRWLADRLLTPETAAKVEGWVGLASENGLTPAQLGILWCLRNPHVTTVLLGASNLDQLRENLEALDHKGRVDARTWEAVDALFGNRPILPAY
jgi:voltage-dependent potassium channel beta subunit